MNMAHKLIINDETFEFENYDDFLDFLAQHYGFNNWNEYLENENKLNGIQG